MCYAPSSSNACLIGPTRVHTQNDISICSAVFSQLPAEGPYILQRAAPLPSKLPLCIGDLDPQSPSNTRFLGPTKVHKPNGISMRAHDCAMTHRLTNIPQYSVSNNSLHHMLHVSTSPASTATGFVNTKWQFLTSYSIDTPQPIIKKFVTGDYNGDPYSCDNFGAHPSMGLFRANG